MTTTRHCPRVGIIGGGLAGTACAHVLRKLGARPEIFETADALAWGASGNPQSLVNPRLSATLTPESAFYAGAFALAVDTFRRMPGIGFRGHGSLHLATTEELRARYRRTPAHWGWPPDHMRYVEAEEASAIAGITVRHPALWLPDAGSLDPEALCRLYAQEVPAHLGLSRLTLERRLHGWSICGEVFDAVILACGLGVRDYEPAAWLPLHPVRGQLALIEATGNTEKIRCALCYGGTIAPQSGGIHVAGSTFQKGETDTAFRGRDEAEIIEKLQTALPDLSNRLSSLGGRAAVRAVAHDRFPVAGRVPDRTLWEKGAEGDLEGLYVTTAHGSHGTITTLAAAHHIGGMIMNMPGSLSRPIGDLLSPARFLRRARRRLGTVLLNEKDRSKPQEGEESNDIGNGGQKDA